MRDWICWNFLIIYLMRKRMMCRAIMSRMRAVRRPSHRKMETTILVTVITRAREEMRTPIQI